MWPPVLLRNVALLALCQAMFFMANTVLISTSPLVGLALAPDHMLATLPLGVQFIGATATAIPASHLMSIVGRRIGLAGGALLGVAAGAVGAWAVIDQSFAGFLLASLLYGCFSGFCQFFRFTAADAADHSDPTHQARPRAIALVLAGGVIAAFLGPLLATLSKDLIAQALFAGCYVAIAGLAVLTALLLAALDLPPPKKESREGPVRPAREIFRQPDAITALVSALAAYLSMNLLMTATPLAMRHEGHMFESTAFVIQWHVVGMFAPSFFTGSLIARFGEHRMIVAGTLFLLAAVAIDLSGVALPHFTMALLLLGIGWNFMFIGATTLLTRCYRPAEKAKAQGVNDLLLFSLVAISATSSGALHHALGWQFMNLAVLPLLAASLWLTLPGARAATTARA